MDKRRLDRDLATAERWANISMWLSGCVLVLWAIPVLVGVAVAVWIFLALR